MIGFSWNCWRSRRINAGKVVGKALMAQAENIARANGCIGLWLDTYEFQARGFYEKLGFEVFT
jgi:GNAT superfamily N-acetyltransferase